MTPPILDAEGLPIPKARLEGNFTGKFYTEDWTAIGRIMRTLTVQHGRTVSIVDIVRAGIHRFDRSLHPASPDATPPTPPAAQVATGDGCETCEGQPDGTDYSCGTCGRMIGGTEEADRHADAGRMRHARTPAAKPRPAPRVKSARPAVPRKGRHPKTTAPSENVN